MVGRAEGGRVGQLSRAARRPLSQPRQEIRTQWRRLGLYLWPEGWVRGWREARLQCEAVLAPRQHRRHALADHSPRFDDTSAADGRAESAGWRWAGRGAPVNRP